MSQPLQYQVMVSRLGKMARKIRWNQVLELVCVLVCWSNRITHIVIAKYLNDFSHYFPR